jgi:hypothetical protein
MHGHMPLIQYAASVAQFVWPLVNSFLSKNRDVILQEGTCVEISLQSKKMGVPSMSVHSIHRFRYCSDNLVYQVLILQ